MAATDPKRQRFSTKDVLQFIYDDSDDESASNVSGNSSDDSDNEFQPSEQYLADAEEPDDDGPPPIPDDASVSDTDDVDSDRWCQEGEIRDRFPFLPKPGINVVLDTPEDPYSYFSLFFDDFIVSHICEQTNLFAHQFLEEKSDQLSARARASDWKDTTPAEILVYLGLLLLQGLVYKSDVQLYFSKKEMLRTPFFEKVMMRDRFLLISKFLHFANNRENVPGIPRKLYKLWPILEHFKKQFSSMYTLEREIAVDESLTLWRGRLGWRQYIPSKRSRYGIKTYELCESRTGYVWSFLIYTGSDTAYLEEYKDLQYMGSKVVMSLVHPLLDKGYTVNMDNFFSSPGLFKTLCSRNTDAVGTLRSNRKGIPQELTSTKLRKGQIKALYCGRLMALKWRDKKDVHMLSTYHDASTVEVQNFKGEKVTKPVVCVDYNTTMGGVDLSDSFLASYPSARKRLRKWYQKQFRHLMDIAVLNAFVIYRQENREKKCTRTVFIEKLCERIFEVNTPLAIPEEPKKRKGRPSLTASPSRLTARHFPSILPPTDKRERPARRCFVCWAKGVRKETIYICQECDKTLCPAPCFQSYHTKTDFTK